MTGRRAVIVVVFASANINHTNTAAYSQKRGASERPRGRRRETARRAHLERRPEVAPRAGLNVQKRDGFGGQFERYETGMGVGGSSESTTETARDGACASARRCVDETTVGRR